MKRRTWPKEKRDTIRMIKYTQSEWAQVEKDFSKSSCRTYSQYIRDLTLKSPFSIYRNRSFDAFVEEIVCLRKQMQEIGGKALLTTENQIRLLQIQQQIKDSINKLIDLCMQ